MTAQARLAGMLKDCGAVLLRAKKHVVWKLPNGKSFTCASTPSDYRAEANQISHLRHALGQVPDHKEGERRERRLKNPPTRRADKYLGTVNNSLANALLLSGVAENSLRKELSEFKESLASVAAERDTLRGELDACWCCRLRNWWRKP